MGHSLYRALAVALLIGLASLGCQSADEDGGGVVTVDPEAMTADGGGMRPDAAPPEGLGLDEENESDMHEERIKAWTAQVRGELGLDA